MSHAKRRESDIRLVIVVVADTKDPGQYRSISVASLREVLSLPVDERWSEFIGRSFRVDPALHRETWSACLDMSSGRFAWADLLEALVEERTLDQSVPWVAEAMNVALTMRVLDT